ncbi:MAG TPA: serine/threonine-protein kinase [Gemmataceae bacterium]|nr:serine/threonine-protein kinase [Gemmataceae bacterium]
MAASNALLQGLSHEQRRFVEGWLVEFEQTWDEGRLLARTHELPADPTLRRPLLIEMAKIDLERQWQRNRRPCLEEYLRDYPELGTVDTVPADLLQAEYEVRQQFDRTADLSDYACRFPHQVEALQRLLAQTSRTWPGPHLADPARVTPASQLSTQPSAQSGEKLAPLPECFGRYRIRKRLAQGGMGAVYLAHDTQLDRPVALKVPHFSLEDDPTALERFYREARAAATLDHPNLCPVHDVGEVSGTHYLTMAYIEGESLAERLDHGPMVSPRESAALVGKIAVAVGDAHAHGVIHRDLKPANIMLNRRGEPVVMDFGLARRVKSEDIRLTRSGSLVGTPAYMAPEQVAGDLKHIGPANDVYSLGVILYELLTGQLPFAGTLSEVLARKLTHQPQRPSALRPEVDPRLEAICLQAMAREPADRYASMTEFAAALDRYLAAPASGKRGGKQRWLALAGGVVVLVVVAIVIVIRARDGDIENKVPGKVDVPGTGKVVNGSPAEAPAPRPAPLLAEKYRLTGFSGEVRGGAFSADGKRAVAVGQDRSIERCDHAVRFWNLETGEQGPDKPRGYRCDWIDLAPDGQRYLVGGHSAYPSMRVLEVDSGLKLRDINIGVHTKRGRLSRDGQYIILYRYLILQNGSPHAIRVYDVKSEQQIADLRHPGGEARCIAISPDGSRGFSANQTGAQLWDVAKGKGWSVLSGVQVTSADFSPDGKSLITGENIGRIRLLSANEGKEIRLFEHKQELAITCLAFSRDGTRVASGSADKTIRLWDAATGKELQRLDGHTDTVTCLAFSADGQRLLSGSKDRTVRLWEVK